MTSLMSHNCISNSKTIIKSDYSGECRATSFIPAGEEITKQVQQKLELKGNKVKSYFIILTIRRVKSFFLTEVKV